MFPLKKGLHVGLVGLYEEIRHIGLQEWNFPVELNIKGEGENG